MLSGKRTSSRYKLAILSVLATVVFNGFAESLPVGLQGTWRITKLLPTTNVTCWSADQAQPLIGTTLMYAQQKMSWMGGDVPLTGIVTRTVTSDDLKAEFGGGAKPVNFAELQIKKTAVMEVDLQHEDADITGASTEVPGDSVLLAAPDRIVASACGVFFEATRDSSPKHKAHR